MRTLGLYPGSFDPLTFGHLDIIQRASKLFDELEVVIAVNTAKQGLFSVEERQQFLHTHVSKFPNVRVTILEDELLAHYYRRVGATALVRGLRSCTDFEYEYAIDTANKHLNPQIETVLLNSSEPYRYMSSSLIKEIALFDGDLQSMVPPDVAIALHKLTH